MNDHEKPKPKSAPKKETLEETKHQLGVTILNLKPKGLSELIEFLKIDGALEAITDDDVNNIALMREWFEFEGRGFFGGGNTMGKHIATVLHIAKNSKLGAERVLSELVDTQNTLNKTTGDSE